MIHGDIERFMAPVDSHGRKCGFDEEVANQPYLVFFDLRQCVNIHRKCETPQVCRSECPSSNWFSLFIYNNSLEYTRKHMICETGVDVSDKNAVELVELIKNKKCAEWYLKSTSFVKRCIPNKIPIELLNLTTSGGEEVQKFVNALAYGEKIIDTIVQTRSAPTNSSFYPVRIKYNEVK